MMFNLTLKGLRLSWLVLFLGLNATGITEVHAQLIFQDGFEYGIGLWNPVPANTSMSMVSREGNQSVRFIPVATDKRSELVINNDLGKFNWGTEYWEGFSINIVKPTFGFGIISQHHSTPSDWNYTAGPNSFTIKIADENNFEVRTSTLAERVDLIPTSGSATWGTEEVVIPFTLNTWYDFVLHFRYAPDETGFIEVWVNGQKVVDRQGPNVYRYDLSGAQRQPIQYQKIGMYYGDGNQSVAGELLYDAVKIWKGSGGSYELVAPGNDGNTVSTPQFSISPGTYSGTQSVGINTVTSGATIRYTLDGTVPSQTHGTVYLTPIPIESTATIKAMAYKSGMNDSQVLSGDFVILLPPPSFTPDPGTYLGPQMVSIGSASPGTTIRYTLDGSDPGPLNGLVYSEPVLISVNTTLKAIAYTPGINESSVVTGTYTILSGGGVALYEAESIPVSGIGTLSNVADVNASPQTNGQYSLLSPPSGSEVGSYATYVVDVPEPGTYNVKTRITLRNNRGIYQLKIDEVNQGTAHDYYADGSTTLFPADIDLGSVTLTRGEHSFSFVCAGKNPKALQAKMGLDYILLSKVAGSPTPVSTIPGKYSGLKSVYPNPSGGIFHFDIELESHSRVGVAVFTGTGHQVLRVDPESYEAGTHSLMVDLTNWSLGIYFAVISLNNDLKTLKLIKE